MVVGGTAWEFNLIAILFNHGTHINSKQEGDGHTSTLLV